MTLDFMSIYEECAGQPWSMYDNDPDDVEDFETAMSISINKALSYLWNLYPWDFRKKTMTIKTKSGKDNYTAPEGQIIKRTLSGTVKYSVLLDKEYLTYLTDYDTVDEDSGTPTSFHLEGSELYLYPTPDDVYEITIKYLLAPFGLDSSKNKLYELTNEDDYVNIDERYEVMFKNCLISKAMLNAIAEETDENYSAYEQQYEDALQVLVKNCHEKITGRNIVW